MTARSDRFTAPSVDVPTAGVVLYQVPADRVVLLKSIMVHNQSGTVVNGIRLGVTDSASNNRVWTSGLLPVSTLVVFETWLVFEEGEDIHASREAGGSIRAALHGALLVQ